MVKTTKQWVHCVSSKVGGYAWLSFMLCPFGVFFLKDRLALDFVS
jgi:hypothetical protein